MRKKYKFAGRITDIETIYTFTHEYCADYIYTGSENADINVRITPENIAYERMQAEKTDPDEADAYSDDYLESLAVYRRIADKMLDFDTFLFHGSVIAADNRAYIFTAKSGTGKSTHTALWRRLLGEKAVMVNDDKPLIRITENGALACGTPYNGKHGLGTNIEVPVKAVCVLTRSPENYIEELPPSEAFPILYAQTYRPTDAKGLSKTLELMDRFMTTTKIYRGGFNMDISAAKTAYKAMSK